MVDGQEVTTTRLEKVTVNVPTNDNSPVLRDALAKLKDANTSVAEKKEARKSIEAFLSERFEADQNRRREQIEYLESQVAKLRKLLEKREEAKSKIIELRMQLLDNDADGLAFPEAFNDLQRLGGSVDRASPFPELYQPNTLVPPSQMAPSDPFQSLPLLNPSVNPAPTLPTGTPIPLTPR
jgi:hypothetical protein